MTSKEYGEKAQAVFVRCVVMAILIAIFLVLWGGCEPIVIVIAIFAAMIPGGYYRWMELRMFWKESKAPKE